MEKEKKARSQAKKRKPEAKKTEKPTDPEKEKKQKQAQAKKRNKLARGGKVGRPRKLSPDELRRGVEAYFASISYLEPVTREEYIILGVDETTGAVRFQLDDMGHRAVRQAPVTGADGKPLMRTVYVQPPGDYGLCNYLKISRDTWDRYGKALEQLEADKRSGQPEERQSEDGSQIGAANQKTVPVIDDEELQEARQYAEIYALARGRVCAYLESASEGKGGKGAQFKLERIYGLGEKKELTVSAAGGGVEAYLRSIGGEAEY